MIAQLGEQFIQLWTRFMQEFMVLTGFSTQQTQILLWSIGGILVLAVILIPLHRWLKRKKVGLKKEITRLVDEMIYLSALAQAQSPINLKSLGGNPHLSLFQTIFKQGNADYIKNDTLILTTLHKVETILGHTLISPQQEAQLLLCTKHFRLVSFFELFLKIIISIPTL